MNQVTAVQNTKIEAALSPEYKLAKTFNTNG